MTPGPLTGEDIRDLLASLAVELDSRGIQADLFLVGGAALAVAYDARRATRDVDAVFEPKSTVYGAAVAVADRHGLDPDWLNDAVKGFLHGEDPEARPVFDRPGLRVDVASPRYMLAMKLLAARDDDIDDIRDLYRACGFTTAEEGLRLVEAAYPESQISPKVQFMLEEMFPPT